MNALGVIVSVVVSVTILLTNSTAQDLRQFESRPILETDITDRENSAGESSENNPIELAEKFLTSFDISLAAKLKPYVQQLPEKGKEQFLKDIEDLNEAIENEILAELFSKAEDTGDLSSSYGKISKDVVDRVLTRYQDKPWISRLMNFAGNEIEETVKN